MATVRPFRGLRYNTSDPLSVALVTAPPYDCITPDERDELYRTHPHNIVRVILGRDEPADTDQNNKYTRAAGFLEKWQDGGVLVRDDEPALYWYQQEFEIDGKPYTREGFLGRIELEPFGEGDIYPHEQTMPGPKADRLRMMHATRANLEPIFALYPDDDNTVTELFHEAGLCDPIVQTVDGDGVVHRLFACTHPGALKKVTEQMAKKPLFIADGHHRYETALTYAEELRAQGEKVQGGHPANSILMMCVSMHHPGLAVLPTHRIVRGLGDMSTDDLQAATEGDFRWSEYTGAEATSPRMDLHLERTEGHPIGLWTRDTQSAFVLQLRDESVMEELAPDHSEAWRQLDPAILRKVLFEKDLSAADVDVENLELEFVHRSQQAFDAVHEEGADAAFVMLPLPVSSLQEVAGEGERMPPKSTYFYPKLLSGLILNPLDE